MSLPLPNLALILAGRALRDVLNGWDRALQMADCWDAGDVLAFLACGACMALLFVAAFFGPAIEAMVLAGRVG